MIPWQPRSSLRSPPATSSPATGCEQALRRLLDGLVGLVVDVRPGARDERRADALRDALLRDHALGDVTPRGQLEHHVEQGALDDRPEPAGAGLPLERLVGDLPERVVGEDELDPVVAEEALVLA